MNNFTVLNYQGSKNNLSSFIYKNLEPYMQKGKAVFDIFSGSAAVSNMFRDSYPVYANDVEPYASIIADAVLSHTEIKSVHSVLKEIEADYLLTSKKLAKPILGFINNERSAIFENNYEKLMAIYKSYPTVWNNKYSEIIKDNMTVENIRNFNGYYLFTTYYATNYYGIEQALEIDCIIKLIHTKYKKYINVFYTCLFYAMKETVFSKDGHMAQPLNPEKNQKRLFVQREKHIYDLFIKKYQEYVTLPSSKYADKNRIYNADFEELLDTGIFSDVGLVYADPPYTDMQYSRYYHLLNVAVKYEYPDLTIYKSRYTKGLYTEGRYQSKLSKRSSAKKSLEKLIQFCATIQTNLAISYAYPQDRENQATNRYTVTIDELIQLAQKYYSSSKVHIITQSYSHANHRNTTQKKVLEYLILCGEKNIVQTNFETLKNNIRQLVPNKNNVIYNSHIYWSQKAYNICDILINTLSNKGDIVFDPFLGSGVTALEAIQDSISRAVIGCDINDVPVFISETLLSINNIDCIKNILKDFLAKIKPLKSYYNTICPNCKGIGVISKVVFDKEERKKNLVRIKAITYSCTCIKRGVKEADNDDYLLMQTPVLLKNIKNTSLLADSKIAVSENDDIKNIFTNRNLAVLDEILEIINTYDKYYQNVLKYILMSILHLCKITDKHSNSQWPLWIPKIDCVEKNILDILSNKVKKFEGVVSFMKDNYSNAKIVKSYNDLQSCSYLLMKKGSQNITRTDIPDNGVDLIITDPPYLGQIPYSEYMQLYKPFLGLNFNLDDEIVVSSAPSRNKNKDNYFDMLQQVFEICSKKLKINHYLCLYFHDSSLEVWNKLITILENNCFRFITQIHIAKTNTLKNIISPKKSLNGDSILIFSREEVPVVHAADEDIEEIEYNIIQQSKFMVKSNGSLSTPELYDNGLMEILIQNGWLNKFSKKYSSLIDIFEKHLKWDVKTGKWML